MSEKEETPERLEEIIEQLKTLALEGSPKERRKALLNAFLNLALIPDDEFIAIQTSRADTLLVVYEEILAWD